MGLGSWIAFTSALVGAWPATADVCRNVSQPDSVVACEREIAREADPVHRATLLFLRAYAFNEAENFEAALADLDAALVLTPSNPLLLHERAYTLIELARYHEAEATLDAEARVQPDNPAVYQERALARFHQANLRGAFEDRDRVVGLAPGDSEALLARAKAALWLGRFDEARRDHAAALALSTTPSEAGMETDEIDLWARSTPNGRPQELCQLERLEGTSPPPYVIGDCTAWFLSAQTPAEQADALTTRSVALRLLRGSDGAGIEDLSVAAALDPDNWRMHFNLGQSYLEVRHSWAARLEFQRSLELERNSYGYAGRSIANFNLGDVEAATADALASLEIEPNFQAFIVLGDIAMYHQHDTNAARRHWLAAYRLGPRDDRLIARLREVGVLNPEELTR
ncbi:MAG: hypothetical protein JNM59_02440 [Hyphomonadaceae bacterium]|nr:hypothetical protein [Hyphomonadaceae bacterium]